MKNGMNSQTASTSHGQATRKGLLALASVLMALTISNTGCGHNDSGGGGAAVPIPVAPGIAGIACTGCPTSPVAFTTAIADSGTVELALTLYGDSTALAASQAQNSGHYSGPMMATGYFDLPTGLAQCNIPAGRYSLQPVAPATFGIDGAGRAFSTITLQAAGTPIQLILNGFITQGVGVRGHDGNVYQNTLTPGGFVVKRSDTFAACDISSNLVPWN